MTHFKRMILVPPNRVSTPVSKFEMKPSLTDAMKPGLNKKENVLKLPSGKKLTKYSAVEKKLSGGITFSDGSASNVTMMTTVKDFESILRKIFPIL